MCGERGDTGAEETILVLGALQDDRCARVADRQRREFSAEHVANMLRRVVGKAADVLTADDKPPSDDASTDHVVHQEHAGQHPRARVLNVEIQSVRSAYRLLQAEAERRFEPLGETPALVPSDRAVDDTVDLMTL